MAPEIKDEETCYHFELTCGSAEESRVRALLVGSADHNKILLTALHSEDLEGGGDRVRVSASLRTPGRNDACMEELVSRISLEPTVNAIRWQVETPVVE